MPGQQAEFTHQDEDYIENNSDSGQTYIHINTDAVNQEIQEI